MQKEGIDVSKIKKVFGGILVTVVIWTISRFIPSLLSTLFPEIIMFKAFALIITLPIGWLAASAISKGRFSGCIRANLYLFAFIEATGIFEALSYILRNLSFSTGIFNYDMNGIAYSDYLIIFGGLILLEIAYIGLCIYLAKKKTCPKEEESTPPKPEIIEKNHEEKQRLRNEISKMKVALKQHDEAYEANKKILAESFTDKELQEMASKGQFPADHIDEYISQRNSLAFLLNTAPQTRETIVKLIGDLARQLAELEAAD